MGDEINAPQYERNQEHLTECSIGLHHTLKIRAVNFQQFARFARAASDQGTPSRKLANFAGEIPAAEDSDDGLLRVRKANDFDASTEHNKNASVRVSLIEEDFTNLRAQLHSECGNASNLRVIQCGKSGVIHFGCFRHSYIHGLIFF
jgi:hypothetical protein